MTRRRTRSVHWGWCALAMLCSSLLGVAALAAEPASELPLRAGGSFDLWRTAVKAIFIAVLCLAIAASALYAWRRRVGLQPGVPATAVGANVEWARRASPRTTLLVIRWQGKRYLLAENSTTTQLIDSRAVEEPRA